MRRKESDNGDVDALIQLYQLSKDELDDRVHQALRNLERPILAPFIASRRPCCGCYPLEAGIDPQFHEDEGQQFERIFDEQWDLWLDQELSLKSSHADDWRKILKKLDLEQIKGLARSLCSETVELTRREANQQRQLDRVLRAWLQGLTCNRRQPEREPP